jgi:tight adherence protein C
MEIVLPLIVFVTVFAGMLAWNRRAQRTVERIGRHEMVAVTGAPGMALRPRTQLLDVGSRAGAATRLAAKATREEARTKAGRLLMEAGSPMPLATFLLLRAVCTFVLAPLFVIWLLREMGLTVMSVWMVAIGAFTLANLPLLRVKRKARKRAKAIEQALPDALDLLVVCAEGGLSLDGSIQQVSLRTSGTLANELRRLQGEIGSGMPRREAFNSLGQRSQAESLKIFCTTMVQADKMGMSIATTMRTLADTLRTRRRQLAETQARKAPIKMLPFLVFFMIPSLFIIILGPAVRSILDFMENYA